MIIFIWMPGAIARAGISRIRFHGGHIEIMLLIGMESVEFVFRRPY